MIDKQAGLFAMAVYGVIAAGSHVHAQELEPHQGSGVLSSASWSDGFAVVKPGDVIRAGDILQYIRFQSP